jgi:hypothetical protein
VKDRRQTKDDKWQKHRGENTFVAQNSLFFSFFTPLERDIAAHKHYLRIVKNCTKEYQALLQPINSDGN